MVFYAKLKNNQEKREGNQMKKIFSLLICLGLLAGCGNNEQEGSPNNNESNEGLEKVKLVLDWTPNTNHTGLYVAQDKGFFEEEGLDVEIIMPGEATAENLVASAQADFGISYQEGVTLARTQDIPLVSIAAIIQHNTSGFASLKEQNITSPKDFEGKTYGGWGSPIEAAVIESLMKQEKASIDKVEILNVGNTDFFTALQQNIDFFWIYYGWTGIEAEMREIPINMVWLADYSEKLDYYTPVIITNEEQISDNPETVRKFIAAVAKGYEFAIKNPEEAANLLIDAVPELDAELVRKSQEWLSAKYQDDAPRWGEQKLEVWKNYADWMFENGLMEKELEAEKAFTNEFLPE